MEAEQAEANSFKFPQPRVDPEKILYVMAGTERSNTLQEPAVQMRGTMDDLWKKDLEAVFTTVGAMKAAARAEANPPF